MTDQLDPPARPALGGAIVVGVDDSPSALAAAIFAQRLAARTGGPCHLVHVAPPGRDSISADLRMYEALSRTCPDSDMGMFETIVGRPAESLIARAAQLDARLLVLGAKHHPLLRRWVAGSTAVRVVRKSPLPVLIVVDAPVKIDRVLVGADATPAAEGAIRHAEAWAASWEATIRVVHAMPLPEYLPDSPEEAELEPLRRCGEMNALVAIWPLLERPGT